MTKERIGPFWDMIEGRRPPPPAAALLGWTLRAIDPDAGSIEVEFAGVPQFLNPAGTIQGGLLGAMLDDTMGPAAMAFLGGRQMAQTLELKINFMRPGRIGPIIGTGRVAHKGRDILFLEGALRDPDGNSASPAPSYQQIRAAIAFRSNSMLDQDALLAQ